MVDASSFTFVATVTLAFLLAGFVKGVLGLGLPTVSLAVLSLGMGLPAAIQLMVVPSAITNLWQGLYGGALKRLLKRFWTLLLANALGVWLAFQLWVGERPQQMTALLGVVLCIYALSGIVTIPYSLRVRRERLASPATGLATGLLAGATGSMVMPVVAYLQALNIDRDALVQLLGLSFTVSTLGIGVMLAGGERYDGTLFLASSLALAPALIGMAVGQRVRSTLSLTRFRQGFFLMLLLIGIHLTVSTLA